MTFSRTIAAILSCAMLTGCASGADVSSQSVLSSSISTIAMQSGDYQEEDTDATWSIDSATSITFAGTTATVSGSGATANGSDITITAPGTYIISGTLADGQLKVSASASDLVRIVLNGVSITCLDSAPIYIEQADKVVLILADGTENSITDTENYVFGEGEDEPSAAIFSKDDLSITGSGTLKVNANYRNGITSKDDLVITNGTFVIQAVNHGLRGKDSVRISGGSFTIESEGDGIQSDNDTDESKGYIVLDGGTFQLNTGNDGIQAETALYIADGSFQITTGDGAASVTFPVVAQGGMGHMGGRPHASDNGAAPPEGMTPPEGTPPQDNTAPPENTPQQGNMPNASFPQDGTRPERPVLANTATQVNETATDSTVAQVSDTSSGTSDSFKALKSGGNLKVTGGSFTIDAQDDAVHANGDMEIAGGNFTISTGDDGFHADGTLTVTDGQIVITSCYEGLEGAMVQLSGGDVRLTAADDGVNAAGGSDGTTTGEFGRDNFSSHSNYDINISGGFLLVDASGDGLDANGSITISGGTVLVNGPVSGGNSALDYDKQCTVTGGILIAAGSAGMSQTPDDSATQAVISITYSSAQQAGTLATIQDSAGNYIASFAPSKAYQNLIVSSPSLKQGQSYSLLQGGTNRGNANGGLYTDGNVSNAENLFTTTLSSIVTKVSDDGSAVTTGGGMERGGGRPNKTLGTPS